LWVEILVGQLNIVFMLFFVVVFSCFQLFLSRRWPNSPLNSKKNLYCISL